MKAIHAIYMFIVFAAATTIATAQNYPEEYLGLPGDNLNLYAVMNLFQESETLEKFEQNLNSEESMINNLDLNGDKLIDYITVSDYVDGNVHNIVLRAALNRKEQQDVAVFVVEQLSNGAVQIQLIGDEALYGPNYIVEPIYAETPNPGYTGKTYRNNVNVVTTSYYDIAAWPVIRFMYRPGYNVWRSSWYWGYYPTYWNPWRAHYWHYYYGYHYHWNNYYYSHYRHWDNYRCMNYHTYYRNKVRVYSPTVVVNINKGQYRNTYSRPDQRSAGEQYYQRTASNRANTNRAAAYNGRTESRSPSVTNQQTAQRTGTSMTSGNSRTVNRSEVSSSSQRMNSQQRVATKQPDNRNITVQRTQPARSTAVQQTQPSRSQSTVQRSQPSRSQSTVQRSQPSKSQSTVQRSQPSRSQSTVQRSTAEQKPEHCPAQPAEQKPEHGPAQPAKQKPEHGPAKPAQQKPEHGPAKPAEQKPEHGPAKPAQQKPEHGPAKPAQQK